MSNAVLGFLSFSLIGIILVMVLIALWLRSTRRRIARASGTACPECGGDLRGYEDSFTCPHCYAVLGEDADAHDDDDSASVDEEEEWDEEDDPHPLA